ASAVCQPAQPAGPSEKDAVERADYGALPPRGWCGDLCGPLPARRLHQECPAGGLGWRPGHLHVSDERSGARLWAPSPVAHDVIQHRLSPAVAAPCACPSEPGCALLWAVPSHPRGGAGALPGAVGAAARGYPGRARLADRLCPAGRGAPGTVSRLGQLLVCTGVLPPGGAPPPALAAQPPPGQRHPSAILARALLHA